MGSESKQGERPTKTVKLQYPIRLGEKGDLIEEIVFKKPRTKHVFEIRGGVGLSMEDNFKIAAKCCDLSIEHMGELEIEDAAKVIEIFGEWLGPLAAGG